MLSVFQILIVFVSKIYLAGTKIEQKLSHYVESFDGFWFWFSGTTIRSPDHNPVWLFVTLCLMIVDKPVQSGPIFDFISRDCQLP